MSALHSLPAARKATIQSPSWTLDRALFHLVALESSDGIDAAVSSLHMSLAETSNKRNAILGSATNTLLALESFIFPLIFSYDASLNNAFKQYLVDSFPSTASEFMNSTAHRVLENLKSFYVSFPPELDHKDLAEYHFTLDKAGPTLRNFSHATLPLTSSTSSSDIFPSRSGTSQQSPKMQRKGRTQSHAGSSKRFRNQEYQVLPAVQDITQAETDLLMELKQILQVYFSHLTSPPSHQHARTLLSRRLAPSISTSPLTPETESKVADVLPTKEGQFPFVVSAREQEIIYHPSSCFVVGHGTSKTTIMLFKMLVIERTARKLGEKNPRQVFVTQSRVLADKAETYFRDLLSEDEREMKGSRMECKKDHDELLETDDEEVAFTGLPSRFSDLEDKHFPLFLTFDKLCRLLEGDIERTSYHKGSDKVSYKRSHSSKPGASRLAEHILYEDFYATYWPQFQKTAQHLDPTLVWNEFQGVIRGSEQSLAESKGFLDRKTYESLNFIKHPAFANHRTQIYDIFESYMQQKRMRGQYDASDRTHALLRHLDNKLPTTLFDYIYVDGVQDNLLIDIKLLRQLCLNPHGLFWAVDTAQQIISTAFRFSDLKAFLYRIEEANAASSRRYKAVHPRHFTLSINDRSHSGIVNCAHSVIELLTRMWPDSIDVADRESGLIDGPKPVFLSGITDVTTLFRPKDGHQDRLQFGADQCILVRNKSARQELRKRINDALILTIYESKGLEFNDVLLYNFFEDSVVQSDWRVVLNGIVGKKRSEIHVPAFDELRHLGVCLELKFLYMGLTRARNRLWIVDNSRSAEPMKLLWNELGLVELKGPE